MPPIRLPAFPAVLGALLAIASPVAVAQLPAAAPPAYVRTEQGVARGTVVDGGFAFKRLPYAAPPAGRNRWRPAQPPHAWRGVRAATVFGPSCPQVPMGWNDLDAARANEDCLSLNVWTPRLGPPAGAPGLPVMVWIHGGGFNGGSASNEFTDGAKLMRHGVVVVTVDYRLGVLGFLAHPDLARETPTHTSGNYGLSDQLAALRWVQANVARFGGDPANVTAFGQSAGGMAVSWLSSTAQAQGLFHRAILESGSAFGTGILMVSRDAAERAGQEFGSLARLRALPASAVLKRWQAFAKRHPHTAFAQPILDGDLLREQPAKALLAGAGRAIDVLAGSNAQEFSSDQSAEQLAAYLRWGFGAHARAARDYYYPDGTARAPDALRGTASTQLVTDLQFRCGTLLVGQAASPHGWLYEFEQPRPGAMATAHSHELLYVWGNEGEWHLAQPMSPAELALVDEMQLYWTNFARSGDPNGPGLPDWPAFRETDDPYLAIDAVHSTAQTHLRGGTCPGFVQHWSDPRSYDEPALH